MKPRIFAALFTMMACTVPVLAKPGVSCDTIDLAISANEEFVEAILENHPDARLKTRNDMTALDAGMGKALPPEAAKASAAAIATLDAALAAENTRDAMLAAMQNYAVLVAAFKARLPTTQNVAMLDHAGFSLQALSASGTPDWAMVKTVQTALTTDVKAIDKQMKRGPLADLLHDTVTSIDAAIAQSNANWLNASALILLDSVDLVEGVVKNKTPGACH
jgi:hypothetical protein